MPPQAMHVLAEQQLDALAASLASGALLLLADTDFISLLALRTGKDKYQPCTSTQKAHQCRCLATAMHTKNTTVQYLQHCEAALGVEAPLLGHHCPSAGEGGP